MPSRGQAAQTRTHTRTHSHFILSFFVSAESGTGPGPGPAPLPVRDRACAQSIIMIRWLLIRKFIWPQHLVVVCACLAEMKPKGAGGAVSEARCCGCDCGWGWWWVMPVYNYGSCQTLNEGRIRRQPQWVSKSLCGVTLCCRLLTLPLVDRTTQHTQYKSVYNCVYICVYLCIYPCISAHICLPLSPHALGHFAEQLGAFHWSPYMLHDMKTKEKAYHLHSFQNCLQRKREREGLVMQL